MKKVELLAPAGNMECFHAAINAGCDAIYIGGSRFNARMNATNFSDEEIIQAIQIAHIHNVKVYVGINISIFEEEIKEVIEFIDFLYLNDVDALIVADLGLIELIRRRYPKLDVHVSTQQNTHNINQVLFLEQMGVKRIVLSREVDLKTIQTIRESSFTELEVFVHGALCVCYSGNCYHSSLIGKRSGNRGKCAQPCRMEYTLLENNRPISSKKYMLSMKDLNTIEHIDKIIQSGVNSLKIEGRMKSKEYVYYVVKSYRDAIDNYYTTHQNKIDKKVLKGLNKIFSRGFTKGYINHEFSSEITNTYRPSHLGELIGKVISSYNNRVKIKLSADIFQKDKIVFVQKEDVSFYLSKIYVKNKLVNKAYKNEIIEIEVNSKIENNVDVYRCQENQFMEDIMIDNVEKKVPIRMKLIANVGEKIVLQVRDFDNHFAYIEGDIVEKALKSPTSSEKIKEQLLKLNTTSYKCDNIKIQTDDDVIIPLSKLNDLRRKAVAMLDGKRSTIHNRLEKDVNQDNSVSLPYRHLKKQGLRVKVKNIYQLEAISHLPLDGIYYDDVKTYNLALKQFPHLNLILSLPRIDQYDSIKKDLKQVSIQQLGDYRKYEGAKIYGDLYLNITNSYELEKLLSLKFESICVSLELSKKNLQNMIDSFKQKHNFIPPLEMVVYGRYQTMIMKHCFVSKEYEFNKAHCGACKNKNLSLVDRKGFIFPISTDENCNVTIYNSKATHLIEHLDEILDMGIRTLRLDFSVENPQDVYNITKAYLDAINHQEYALDIRDVTYGHYHGEEL